MRALPLVDFSLCCALGSSVDAVARQLSTGQTGLRAAPFELGYAAPSGLLLDALPPLPGRLAAYETRQARLTVATLEPLLGRIGATVRRVGAERVGVVLGSSNGGLDTTERVYAARLASSAATAALSLNAQHAFHAMLSVIRELTGIAGPAHVVSTACSSSGKAFASGARLIAAGLADAVLVGGIDALCEMTLRGFRSLGVLAEEPCRPFGVRRPGINIGEGAALFLLERDADAGLALLGCGETSDGYHMTAPEPDGEGAERAMQQALHDAQLDPSAIDLINAHATGTDQGDSSEARALERLFGARTPVISTKGYTGHALGAAGAVEAALSLICMQRSLIPCSLGAAPLDASLALDVVQQPRSASLRNVLSNSFAFGGSNVCVIFGKAA